MDFTSTSMSLQEGSNEVNGGESTTSVTDAKDATDTTPATPRTTSPTTEIHSGDDSSHGRNRGHGHSRSPKSSRSSRSSKRSSMRKSSLKYSNGAKGIDKIEKSRLNLVDKLEKAGIELPVTTFEVVLDKTMETSHGTTAGSNSNIDNEDKKNDRIGGISNLKKKFLTGGLGSDRWYNSNKRKKMDWLVADDDENSISRKRDSTSNDNNDSSNDNNDIYVMNRNGINGVHDDGDGDDGNNTDGEDIKKSVDFTHSIKSIDDSFVSNIYENENFGDKNKDDDFPDGEGTDKENSSNVIGNKIQNILPRKENKNFWIPQRLRRGGTKRREGEDGDNDDGKAEKNADDNNRCIVNNEMKDDNETVKDGPPLDVEAGMAIKYHDDDENNCKSNNDDYGNNNNNSRRSVTNSIFHNLYSKADVLLSEVSYRAARYKEALVGIRQLSKINPSGADEESLIAWEEEEEEERKERKSRSSEGTRMSVLDASRHGGVSLARLKGEYGYGSDSDSEADEFVDDIHGAKKGGRYLDLIFPKEGRRRYVSALVICFMIQLMLIAIIISLAVKSNNQDEVSFEDLEDEERYRTSPGGMDSTKINVDATGPLDMFSGGTSAAEEEDEGQILPPYLGVPTCDDDIAVMAECFSPGQQITLVYRNCDPRPDDWVGMYTASVEPNHLEEEQPAAWVWTCGNQPCSQDEQLQQQLQSDRQSGGSSSVLSLAATDSSIIPGTYRIHLVRRNSLVAVASTAEFLVAGNGLTC